MTEATTCIFCRIARGELPATVVFSDDDVFAFRDLHPRAPTHVLLIPRKHIGSVDELDEADSALLGRLFIAARDVARQLGISSRGYRLVVNTGDEGGQTVGHLHLHLIGGRPLAWPPE